MLAASPTTTRTGEPAEEWAIHDHEGFGGLEIDPHESLEEVHHRATLRLRDTNTSDIIIPEIRLARRSTRKHRISPTRIQHALRHATKVAAGNPTSDGKPVVMIIGCDAQGVEIEVGAVIDDNVVTLIHAMPTRSRRRST